MPPIKKERPQEKSQLHPRNLHRERYDFDRLIGACPALKAFVRPNPYGDLSIDFFDPKAVKTLNKALLSSYYQIEYWDIPDGYLCPPIPGRADYIHHIADLLGEQSTPVRCLDVGVGANCVYPIIGIQAYGWSFVGADIDSLAIRSAQQIIDQNSVLSGKIELRLQSNARSIFTGIIQKDERFDLTMCNPPFHASQAAAQAGSTRKLQNLKRKKVKKTVLNFGGQSNELWCEGGEERFVRDMIEESKQFAKSCRWFSTLISKQAHLKNAYWLLDKAGAVTVKTIPMGQGNKTSRILAWSFRTPAVKE
ncbi:23S rRNA (adenine(1618)-N(6))-methyltransferase RlmF [Reichenbachiella agarivorans]|uniref:Ribosomal RNA large subunit methyltransferase F n=1 Tax=Reichenbachiella agarivorans TaxID=2979464 RepID=A0ABY6CJY2_9BACT|nr:23S rRNA (adenine(1618)-N(6))-methyltransferase RlmF [Reichenbachiella agarivorans]UXP30821.1 23S rRNA (adenine(1618)-N(6))-methyltransferase RlmF [Reichenbachiella agarivorans]